MEILLWIGIMGFIALRSAMQRQRQEQQKKKAPTPLEGSLADVLAQNDSVAAEPSSATRRSSRSTSSRRRESTAVSRRAPGAPERSSRGDAPAEAGRKRGGLLGRWQELAAELERQMQEQQSAAREPTAAEAGEPERLVVVPGRRVTPTRSRESADERHSRDSHWGDWENDPDSHGLHDDDPSRVGRAAHTPHARSGPPPPRSVARDRSPGLERLESYSPLKRAILLADVLGPPPGLEGVTPAERRWDTGQH